MIVVNKKANFWIRFLATFVDLGIFLLIMLASSFLVFNYSKGTFYSIYSYYPWLLFLIFVLIFLYFVIPSIWDGKTLAMAMCRIKIINKDENKKLWKGVFDRQRLFALVWIIIFFLFIIFISPQTFADGALSVSRQGKTLDKIQRAFLAIPSTFATLGSMLQLFIIISNIKSSRIGLNDKFSSTFTVWINKFEEIEPEENIFYIRPRKRVLPKIYFEN
ncbi:RDD family protein [Mycoplasma struthionis]|uniref:RDD family protein n=1 Tax=Mycoplasma struthionis TaxID=538220 RepID=A0A3G8LFW1_9MOLU|nr:RDD family protein [Mycoplasma struthionis]AZG68516.1 RDD family protein [Mycoplasma struthionis]